MPQAQSSNSVNLPAFPGLDDTVRAHLGMHLRHLYSDVIQANLPHDLTKLVLRLESVIRARTERPDPTFLNDLLRCVPNLRNFAMSLTCNKDWVDDLVQDTILRAWDKRDTFEAGTNLQAWVFTILRNGFYSDHRKRAREVEDTTGSYAASQVTPPDRMGRPDLQDFSSALTKLPPDQRDALILVGAEGMTFDDAAITLGVAVGTVKSRVNRARTRLADLLGLDEDDALGHAYRRPT